MSSESNGSFQRRGFTLIELMLVVTIIGLLASMAITSFDGIVARVKATERTVVVKAIRQAIETQVAASGRIGQSWGGGMSWLSADFNPPLTAAWTPTGAMKTWDPNVVGWNYLLFKPDGRLRFHYSVVSLITSGWGCYWVVTLSDIDGDGEYASIYNAYLKSDTDPSGWIPWDWNCGGDEYGVCHLPAGAI